MQKHFLFLFHLEHGTHAKSCNKSALLPYSMTKISAGGVNLKLVALAYLLHLLNASTYATLSVNPDTAYTCLTALSGLGRIWELGLGGDCLFILW